MGATAQSPHSGDEAAIRQLSASWLAAVNAKDLGRIIDLVTDDVVFLLPEGPPVVGKTAVEELYRRLFSGFELEQSVEIEDIYIAGDRGFIWGTDSLKINPLKGGQQKQTKMLGMTIVQRQPDGPWKISHGINNMVG
jgi:uncharacterized protein (TIGR02246 family)